LAKKPVNRGKLAAVVVPSNATRLEEAAVAAEISRRLAGVPADGSRFNPAVLRAGVVVWTDRGDDVLIYLNSTRVKLLDRMLYVSVDLETDQTGRTPLVCAFAFGTPEDPAGLVAVTDEFPRGNGLLASRWGEALQAAVWNALLGMISDFAKQVNLSPAGFAAIPSALVLRADN
jgi:hypothetical protein